MADISISHYDTGTATVAANGTNVVGQGTAWVGAVRPGDLFGTHRGLSIRILSVNSNTSLTLARAWPGPAQTAAAYEIQLTPRDIGLRQAIEELVTGVSEGNLPLLSALAGAANKLPYFDSANSMATADFPAWARSMLGLQGAADRIPYLTGANGAALTTLTAFARTLLDDGDATAARNTLSVAQKQSSLIDHTAGLSLLVGAFGWGGEAISSNDWNILNKTGVYNNTASSAIGVPSGVAQITCLHIEVSWANAVQIALRSNDGSPQTWRRSRSASGWGEWEEIYSTRNVIRSVSMASGRPTGGLFEYGSTSNGDYLRLADGTQICWFPFGDSGVTINQSSGYGGFTANGSDKFYPASFAATPQVILNHFSNPISVGVIFVNAARFQPIYRAISAVASANLSGSGIAIGRWQ